MKTINIVKGKIVAVLSQEGEKTFTGHQLLIAE